MCVWGGGAAGGTRPPHGPGHALTFSDAVAILVPCRLRAMQLRTPSWAGMSTGGFSVLARSTSCTWPVCAPGKARRELLLFGHRTQRPEQRQRGPVRDSRPSPGPLLSRRQGRFPRNAQSGSLVGPLLSEPQKGCHRAQHSRLPGGHLVAGNIFWTSSLLSLSPVVPGPEDAEQPTDPHCEGRRSPHPPPAPAPGAQSLLGLFRRNKLILKVKTKTLQEPNNVL